MPMMKQNPRYRKHSPRGPLLLGLVRVAFCIALCVFCLARVGQAIRAGEIEAPIRGVNLVVTNASPAWFALALSFYCLMGAAFAYATYGLAAKLIEDFRT